MCGAIPTLPQYIFTAWCLVKRRDFTFLPLSQHWPGGTEEHYRKPQVRISDLKVEIRAATCRMQFCQLAGSSVPIVSDVSHGCDPPLNRT
jgi:hypothetical protein